MQFCKNPLSPVLILLTAMVFAGCERQVLDYAFVIKDVSVSRGYQSLDIGLHQDLTLSQQAKEALHHGVTLTIRLEFELRNDNNMIVVRRETRNFHIRYLPLHERYQLIEGEAEKLQAFSRLRHVLAAIDDLNVQLPTGPLPPGNYELRTRIRLDESLLPAPMQLPALFSSQWRHDSEWSVWPFKVSV
jgi:hypothetical protein